MVSTAALRGQRQVGPCELETNLVYTVSSKRSRGYLVGPCLKNNRHKVLKIIKFHSCLLFPLMAAPTTRLFPAPHLLPAIPEGTSGDGLQEASGHCWPLSWEVTGSRLNCRDSVD